MSTEVSPALEDCAKAIYALAQRAGGEPVTTNALADRLGLSPASVTALVKRLAERGLAEHRPYRGVRLTSRGERVALEVLRHHRLLERYLAEELGLPWDQVHEDAEVLEHVLSERLEQAIAAKLGDPSVDPHGDPIPGADLVLDDGPTTALDDHGAGVVLRFVRVSDADQAVLRHLEALGVRLGCEIELIEREPFGGSLIARVEGVPGRTVLGPELARAMRVVAAKEAAA